MKRLKISTTKTKYLLAQGSTTVLSRDELELSKDSKYLGTLITNDNSCYKDIKSRLPAVSRRFYLLVAVFWSSSSSKNTCPLTVMDEKRLGRWERKIPRRIFGSVCSKEARMIRTNNEFQNLYYKS